MSVLIGRGLKLICCSTIHANYKFRVADKLCHQVTCCCLGAQDINPLKNSPAPISSLFFQDVRAAVQEGDKAGRGVQRGAPKLTLFGLSS